MLCTTAKDAVNALIFPHAVDNFRRCEKSFPDVAENGLEKAENKRRKVKKGLEKVERKTGALP